MLNGFYINPNTLSYLAQLILALVMSVYLLSLRNKTEATWWFFLFYASFTAYALASMAEASALWVRSFYATHLQIVLMALAMLALLQFAYRYPRAEPGRPVTNRREAALALAVSILALLLVAAWALYQFAQMRPGGAPSTNTTPSELWLLAVTLWTFLVFWRRSVAFSRLEAPDAPLSRHLLRPQGRRARAAASFLVSLVLGLAIVTLLLLSGALLDISDSLLNLLPSAGLMVVLFLLAVAYFNYAPENTSFLVKLVGISLVTVLLALMPVSYIVAGSLHLDPAEGAPVAPVALHVSPQPDGSYTATWVDPQPDDGAGVVVEPGTYSLPFVFPFAGTDYGTINLGVGSHTLRPWISNQATRYNMVPVFHLFRTLGLNGATRVAASPDQFTVTSTMPAQEGNPTPTEAQLRLYPDGSFDLVILEMGMADPERVGFLTGSGGSDVALLARRQDGREMVAVDGLLYRSGFLTRQALHPRMVPLAALLIGASLFTLLVFPLFYIVLLIRPLRALTAGVQRVDSGDLLTHVPVEFQDEIGMVTDAFNRMTASVYQADQRLESLVAARTEELAASESRFRELFENMSSGVAILSVADGGPDYVIRDMNRAAAHLEQVSRHAVLGKRLSERLSPREFRGVAELLQRVEQAEFNKPLPPVLFQRASGSWREIVVFRLPGGEVVMVYDDVTERLRAQAQSEELAAMEEREHIGRELHDELGQVLGFISVQSQAALAMLDRGEEERARAALEQLVSEAQTAHGEVRQYILGIRTDDPAARSQPFFLTLDEYLLSLRERYGMDVQLSLPEEWRASPLAPETEMQVLRVIQEALTNVRKHAAEPRARVQFFDDGHYVQVVIADDGPGFDPDQQPADGMPHFGVQIMQERAEQVGGSLQIRSRPGSGAEVILRVPRSLAGPGSLPAGVRVLLVDDHALYREGLRNLLAARGLAVAGVASDGIEAEEQAAALRPDLILMDVQMPRRDGLEATRLIKARFPEIRIVMLTVAAEGETLFEALKAGASGYLLKSLEGEDFFRLLSDVLAGETVLSPALANRMLSEFATRQPESAPDEEAPPALTARQMEVLTLVAAGQTNQEIAAALHVTVRTVKYHVSEILARLQLRSRYELARYAQEQGLVEGATE